MAGRFPLYTDGDVRGRFVHALRGAGWDIMRAVDVYPQTAGKRTCDPIHFARAALEHRVLVSNDTDMIVLTEQAIARGERFAGLVWWPHHLYARVTTGELLARFEALAAEDAPFAVYPIRILSARR